jgi:hypothetical protein
VTLGCVQSDFWANGTFGANHAPILTFSPNGPKWESTWPTSPRSSIGCAQNNFWAYGIFGASRAPILCQDYHYPQTVWIQLLLELHHLGVPSGVSKMIYMPMVHLAQTVHLSCVKTSAVSKQIESSFHLILITSKYHWVRPKWFLSIWYVWCKPFRHLAPILKQSLNGPNGDSTWPTSQEFYRVCPKWFSRHGIFGAYREPILHQD